MPIMSINEFIKHNYTDLSRLNQYLLGIYYKEVDFIKNKIKHLEFIQSNITRMNQCSFHMKGWAITIVSALLAMYATTISQNNNGNVVYFFVAIIPTTLFWLLDSFYHQQENKFRGIYNDVADLTDEREKITVREFEMPLNKYNGRKYCFFKSMWSKTEWSLYFTIIIGLIVSAIIIKYSIY